MDTYTTVTETILTTNEAKQVLSALEQSLNTLYSSKNKGSLFENLSPDIRDELVAAFQDEKIDLADKKKVDVYIKGLIEYLKTLQSVILTVAYRPSQKQVEQLQGWLQKNVPKKLLLEIKVDPAITAGAKVEYNGIYKNYSIHTDHLWGDHSAA
jgi:F0F1-type ATP synthase delta subunit